MVSEALHWVIQDQSRYSSILHYMDVFVFIGPDGAQMCHILVNVFLDVAAELGVSLAADKAEGPCTRLTFLWIELDSVAQTQSLPQAKLSDIIGLLKQWRKERNCTRTELQRIIGSLQFAATRVPAGRLFLRRMIDLLTRSAGRLGRVQLTRNFLLDLGRWSIFLPKWNGKSPSLSSGGQALTCCRCTQTQRRLQSW